MAERPRLHFTSLALPEIVDEVVRTYMVAAGKLGYEATFERASIRADSVNVICFAMTIAAETVRQLASGPDCIVLNFEQLVPGSYALNEHYLNLLRQHPVWEYSASNFARYPALGIERGALVPYGYEEEADWNARLEDRLPEQERDIDVLFFGGRSVRRVAVLDAMRQRGLNVVSSNGVDIWPVEHRNALIKRAKVVLNMHIYENSRIVEIPRISLLLRQRKAVLCELYADSEIRPELRQVVHGAAYADLADQAVALVRSPERRDELERLGPDVLRQFPQTQTLAPALQAYREWWSRPQPGGA